MLAFSAVAPRTYSQRGVLKSQTAYDVSGLMKQKKAPVHGDLSPRGALVSSHEGRAGADRARPPPTRA